MATDDEVPEPGPLEPPAPNQSRTVTPVRSSRRRPRGPQFQVGRVLGATFSIWFSKLPTFLLLTIIVFSPYVALLYWGNEVDIVVTFTWWWLPLDSLLQQVLTHVVSATVIFSVFQKLRGRDLGIGAAVTGGLARVPAVIGVSLVIFLCMVLAVAPLIVITMASESRALLAVFGLVFGLVIMFVTCGLFVAVAACVVERPGIFASLGRSWALTRGYKWHIFGIILILTILQWILGLVIIGLFGASISLDAQGELDVSWMPTTVLVIVIVSLQAVAAAVAYHDLRVTREGIDTEELAAIFD